MSRECAVWDKAEQEGFGGRKLAEASRNVPLPSLSTNPQPPSLLAPAPPRPTSYPFPISPREQSSTIQALSLAKGASRQWVEGMIKQRNEPLPSNRHEPSVSLLINARPPHPAQSLTPSPYPYSTCNQSSITRALHSPMWQINEGKGNETVELVVGTGVLGVGLLKP
ncbi:hypothetical protein L202_08126 [Cryptococcus amylolentus CBS 6039]|uniref:Uncharacterized protein n=1 Tax=Cryptococcus amylolentus CBS 6039 TaxID=1295533 RepID=A0A1E3H8M5_9TREE|nr:hypothetical protein L202_08126 [Cryptococcus amylolentus CBS 6039]ODN72687.1 hypothetical protein L202_08126 [Cryptococcus amylolentus CBS 6039]